MTKTMNEVGATEAVDLVVATLTPGDFFGEATILNTDDPSTAIKQGHYPSNVICNTNVKVLKLHRNFVQLFKWDEQTLRELQKRAVKYLADAKLIQAIRDKKRWLHKSGYTINKMIKTRELDVEKFSSKLGSPSFKH